VDIPRFPHKKEEEEEEEEKVPRPSDVRKIQGERFKIK
jgi:hypothetical protein